jgi:hypothetical protein
VPARRATGRAPGEWSGKPYRPCASVRTHARRSVPAGNSAGLRAGRGPGLPYPVNASQALRRGVDAYDVAPSDPAALHAVLVAADARGTITPW